MTPQRRQRIATEGAAGTCERLGILGGGFRVASQAGTNICSCPPPSHACVCSSRPVSLLRKSRDAPASPTTSFGITLTACLTVTRLLIRLIRRTDARLPETKSVACSMRDAREPRSPAVSISRSQRLAVTPTIRKRLIKAGLLLALCAECGIVTWRGHAIALELHHINGDGKDNRLENLALLCPNCHSQTDSWGGRNCRRGPLRSRPAARSARSTP